MQKNASNHQAVDTEYRLIIGQLKTTMKRLGINYAQLALKLETSEVTIKRVFSGQRNQAHRILEICEVLDLSYIDLVRKAASQTVDDYFLTEDQESVLYEQPILLGVLSDLKSGMSFEDIHHKHAWSDPEAYRITRTLEKARLIRIHPNGSVKLSHHGNLRLKDDGALARKINELQNRQFFSEITENVKSDRVCYHVYNGSITSQTHDKIVKKIHAFGKELRDIARLDCDFSPLNQRHSIRWVFALAPFNFMYK